MTISSIRLMNSGGKWFLMAPMTSSRVAGLTGPSPISLRYAAPRLLVMMMTVLRKSTMRP